MTMANWKETATLGHISTPQRQLRVRRMESPGGPKSPEPRRYVDVRWFKKTSEGWTSTRRGIAIPEETLPEVCELLASVVEANGSREAAK